jgi:hypothetical protein
MIRTVLCLLGLLLFVTITEGQKVKLKDLDVKANLQSFPDIGFPNGVSTYFVDVDASSDNLQVLGYTKTDLVNSINLKGYTKIPENVGAGIYLTIDGPSGSPLKLQTQNKKDEKGKTWSEYHYTVDFKCSIRRKVVDANGVVLSEEVDAYNEAKKSGTYSSTSALRKSFDSEKFYISNRRSLLASSIQNTAMYINRAFAFNLQEKKVEFKRLNSKKHPKFAVFNKTEEITASAFEALTPYDNSLFKEKIAPALQVWLDEEPGLSGKDKEQKKLKFLCQLNASLAYFYSEDFENALKYATMIENGDEDQKKGKKLIKEINEVQDHLKRLNLTSRFFKIETDEAVIAEIEEVQENRKEAISSGNIREFPDFDDKLSVRRESIVVPGKSVNISGYETEGYWVYDNTYFGGPDFREPSRIRFGYLKDGQIEVGTPNFSKLTSVTFDDKTYSVEDVKLGSGLTGLSVKNAVVEVLRDFERTAVVRIFPSFKRGKVYGDSGEVTAEVAVYHKEEEKYKNIKGLTSQKKAIKSIVKGCKAAEKTADVEFKSKGGFFKNLVSQDEDKMEELVKVLKEYDKCK